MPPRTGKASRISVGRCLALACAILITTPAIAQDSACVEEREPNDQPAEAAAFSQDCAIGTLGGDDRQDLWSWAPRDPSQLWQFEVDGIPRALTRVEILSIRRDAAGNVRGRDVELAFEARDGSATSPRFFIAPGDYVIGIATAGATGTYTLRQVRHELPPSAADGAAFSGAFAASGRGESTFGWRLDDAAAGQRWQLMLKGPLDARQSLDLLDAEGRRIVGRASALDGQRSLTNLVLAAGSYSIRVRSSNGPEPFTLEAVPLGTRAADVEAEPNERGEPGAIDPELGMTGVLDGDPTPADYFAFEGAATGQGRRTTVTLRTKSRIPRRLCLLDAATRELQCRQGVGLVSLPDLALTSARYVLSVAGRTDVRSSYSIEFTESPALSALKETEPNDAHWHAPELDERFVVQGRFAGLETDTFRFRAPGTEPQLWRIQVTGSGLRQLKVLDARGYEIALARRPNQGGDRIRLTPLLLLPGTHYLAVNGEAGSYRVRALLLGPPDPNVESEPNDDEATSMPLAFGQTRRGVLRVDDNDRYRFRLLNTERVRLTVTPPEGQRARLRLTPAAAFASPLQSETPGEAIVYEGSLLPGNYGIWLDASAPSLDAYAIKLERLRSFSAPVESVTDFNAVLRFESDTVAAFSEWQQFLDGQLEIKNTSSGAREVALDTHLSDAALDLALERETLTVPANGIVSVGARLTIPADVEAAMGVQVGVREGDRILAVGETVVTPSGEHAPVNPSFAWGIPEPLRGAIDLAAIGLGAEVTVSGPIKAEDRVLQHDAFAPESAHRIAAFDLRRAPLPLRLTTTLRGNSPVPVVGIALHPQNPAGTFPAVQQVKDFDLQLSADGTRFETVFSGTLDPKRREQFFELAEPTPARTARLVIRSTHGDDGRVVLDSWKVLGPPDVLGGGVNLADPSVGGRLVRFDLQSGQRYDFAAPASPLVPGTARWSLRCFSSDCRPSSFVIGFHHDRAAEIVSIDWREAAIANEARIPRVMVAVSADTPVGPWESIGEIRPAAAPHGTHTLTLPAPVRARYVRFEIPADIEYPSALPELVRVFERKVGSDYRSILGEWGWRGRAASAEWRDPPTYAVDRGDDGNNDRATAQLLRDGAEGSVRIGQDVDFFRVDIGNAANTLYVDVGGRPTVGAQVELFDAEGEPHSLARDPDESSPTRERWVATVTPGASYYVRVFEPPRSVMFVWDTSGSVAPFRPVVWQALMRFSSSVTPGREAVNLLPFGVNFPLLDEWEDEPTLIWRALQEHQLPRESSDTGKSLLAATEALATRAGARAVVLISDMALPMTFSAELWQALESVKPRIYLLRVNYSGGPQDHSELAMRHWAAVNDGDARDTPLVDDLELGFARAAARLRRPAPYTLLAEQDFIEPPGPGRLRVASRVVERDGAEPTVLGNTAVEIILDASGSMQQRIGGKRRIDVAKETLTEFVTEIVPAGTPVALRVFGHIEGNYSCRTDLVQPLAPLDAAATSAMIAPLQPQNLAATPIAASLKAVAADLADAPGQKIVVLLTDGEETCDGDPEAEIRALRARDIDVRLNIVGFAIDDAELKANFGRWAELGGGAYFDVPESEALGQAISQALRVPFTVLDAADNRVAAGTVNGDPVELSAGTYRVRVLAEPPLEREVTILGDRDQVLVVGN